MKLAAPRNPSAEDIELLRPSVLYVCGTLISQACCTYGNVRRSPQRRTTSTLQALFGALLTKLGAVDGFFQNFSSKATDAVASDLTPWTAAEIATLVRLPAAWNTGLRGDDRPG